MSSASSSWTRPSAWSSAGGRTCGRPGRSGSSRSSANRGSPAGSAGSRRSPGTVSGGTSRDRSSPAGGRRSRSGDSSRRRRRWRRRSVSLPGPTRTPLSHLLPRGGRLPRNRSISWLSPLKTQTNSTKPKSSTAKRGIDRGGRAGSPGEGRNRGKARERDGRAPERALQAPRPGGGLINRRDGLRRHEDRRQPSCHCTGPRRLDG